MARTVRFALVTLLLAVSTSWSFAQTSAASKSSADQAGPGAASDTEIRKLDQELRQGALKGDASVLEKYLAPNYIGVGSDGKEVTREQAIQSRKNGVIKYDTIDLKETKVRMYRGAAVVDHVATVKGTHDGQPFNGDFHAIFVWATIGGKWKVVSFSSVPIMNMPATK